MPKTIDQPASRAAVRLDPLVLHLIYGDIEEMPLEILGDECPTNDAYNDMDVEQSIRHAAAATVQAWIERRLHKGGYIWDEGRHPPEDLVQNVPETSKENRERQPVFSAAGLLDAWCECLNWPRGVVPEKWYGRTQDGVPLMANHHPHCPHYNDSLIDVWKVTVDGRSCYVDKEQDAQDTVGDNGSVSKEKMHREIFDHLPEFEGF